MKDGISFISVEIVYHGYVDANEVHSYRDIFPL